MRWRGSLLARLSWRLMLLQSLALISVVIVVSIPEPNRRDVRELDDDVLDAIAQNLIVQGDLLIPPDIGVIRAVEEQNGEPWDYPDFWFIVADADGRRAEFGPVPDQVRPLFNDAMAVSHADVYRTGSGPADRIIARPMDGPAGRFAIVTGGGPTLAPIIVRFQQIDAANLFILFLLMMGSGFVIPLLLQRDLAGVSRVADEASQIDIDRSGARLTEANVPVELQGMVVSMNAALARLDEGLEKRRRFLATAAHELRTPVAVLSMRIETLPLGPARQLLMLDVARLASLSDQLLDLERLNGEMHRFALVDLSALAAAAVTDIAPLAVASDADLSFEAPEGPVGTMADGQAILRVVTNLVQNAIAHGGPGVAIAVKVVRPAEVQVRDNGPGVAPTDRTQIFEPFFRRSGTPGSGLGLHLVQEIVTRHGGTIHFSEAPGGGAEFIVRLPPAPPI